MQDSASYRQSVETETSVYNNCVDIHRLPPIFHYWSHRHLRPRLEAFGLSSPTQMFADHLDGVCAGSAAPPHFVSVGAGNCDLELELAATLKSKGYEFSIDCIDLNSTMLERAGASAEAAGLSGQLNFRQADLNSWTSPSEYDAIIASQSLHHVVNLEGLFDQIKQSLRPGASFLISDMIGRNGHQRWPEALKIVQEFWRKLPPSYRFNQVLGYYEEQFENWDCSLEGFEGVRSEDILPLLIDRFHFHFFLAYGNVIDPFIDRAFGHHFNPDCAWDRNFIDEVNRRDEEELASGRLKPTHLIAIVRNEPGPETFASESSVRRPQEIAESTSQPFYDWTWPHDTKTELETACRHLSESGREIKQRTAWALRLANELEDCTAWAQRLEKDLQAHTSWARRLEKDLEDRTTWARTLEQDLATRTELAVALQTKVETLETEIEEKTNWALNLKTELATQIERATRLEAELSKPARLLGRLFRRLF